MSAEGLIISIPENGDAEPLWMRVAGGEIVGHSAGARWLDDSGLTELPRDTRVMLVTPVGLTTLHWTDFPDLTPRQGRAAARLLALDNSIGSAEMLHIATADTGDMDDRHNVAVVSRTQMAQWLLWAQHQGIDPDIILPAGLLLPHPDECFVSGMIGGEIVLRGPDCAIGAADPVAALIVGEAQVREVTVRDVNRAAIAALASPPLNLRQGDFAKRGKHVLDWPLVRSLAAMLGFIAFCSLLIALTQIMKYDLAADAVDAESQALARTVLPHVPDIATAQAQLDARLSELGGGGLAFSGPAAGLYAAMRNVPNASIANMAYTAEGTLSVTLSAPSADDMNQVLNALQQSGFLVTATPQQDQDGPIRTRVAVRTP
ncbi:type II secretion system protein GspL [Rhizorhapis suberifaciens]|uniref:General secretion pathway protein L n=1 Tax=Rhizorhapis suberifaciens TaxID=13656 RepID=A0A840HU55_9SPHN|nr:type II secretion system protein GspL [Rhizorhapis suberifaciens]MBB4641036.1 general secretion pathway protein L [Rhizorhapis suberifaciens]